MAREELPARCLNCGTAVPRPYCGQCGQKNAPLRVPLRKHVSDAIGAHLFLDSRAGRTLAPFLLRPGFLTREYNDGRRVRYSSPLRIYLLMSLLLFVGVGLNRFAADFLLMRHLAEESDTTWFPAPGGVAGFTEPAAETIEELTLAISRNSSYYEQSVSRTFAGLLGEDHPLCQHIVSKMQKVHGMEWAEARLAGLDNWLSLLPTAMFLLLPFCAGILKLCFLGSGRFYVEHLVFVLHLHAFIYLVLLILSWAWNPYAIAAEQTTAVEGSSPMRVPATRRTSSAEPCPTTEPRPGSWPASDSNDGDGSQPPRPRTDEDLLAAARGGDTQAFGVLCLRLYGTGSSRNEPVRGNR